MVGGNLHWLPFTGHFVVDTKTPPGTREVFGPFKIEEGLQGLPGAYVVRSGGPGEGPAASGRPAQVQLGTPSPAVAGTAERPAARLRRGVLHVRALPSGARQYFECKGGPATLGEA